MISDSNRRIIYRGNKIDLALQQVELNNGQTAEREVILHRGAVVLLPLLEDDRVCLIANHRYSINQTLIELPAGTIDPGESPDVTAARELEEETGFVAKSIKPVAEWYVSPGVMNERMFLFVCQDLQPGQIAHQADEILQNLIVPWTRAIQMALSGQIQDAKTLLSLLLWDRLRSL